MPVRAVLYDATAMDREVTLNAQLITELHAKQLLWIDLTDFTDDELRSIAKLLNLKRESLYALMQPERRPRLDNYGAYFQLNIEVIQQQDGKYSLAQLNFILGPNLVVTIHRQSIEFLESFSQRIKGDSDLGQLDAPAFLASLLDWHITSYFRIIEYLEVQIDRIDRRALRPRHNHDLVTELAHLRQQVAFIRRKLTPHREVYAAMARPDFHLLSSSESSTHYTLLNDRLERVIEAIENARELLVGSFDMFTTQITLRTNEVIKVLTLVSVVLLPASVIVGIAALLIKSPVYHVGPIGFWIMIALIAGIGIGTVIIARIRRWI